ncbi:hypothetical protein, partial [Paraburkholderia bryophila]|uniref:hypothetical protein n=1 Tax=Paraburkholderia bryophila TaxID=420952 RepID=UPI001ABB53A9
HDTAKEGEKEDPDTHRITRKAGPTGGSEFNANPGSGFRANQHACLTKVMEARIQKLSAM